MQFTLFLTATAGLEGFSLTTYCSAQVDVDATPFIRFVWHLMRQSALDLQAGQSGRKAARR
jgi:hypothetical protein